MALVDVECDVCTRSKRKALKSCLQCRISYCKQHFQHYFDVPLKKHRLVEAANLQENICKEHDEVKSIFCDTDKQFICINCSVSEHKGHEMVLASTEMAKRQGELGTSRNGIQQRIQSKQKVVKELQQEVEAINSSADEAIAAFEKLINLNERRSSDVKHKIRSKQRIEVNRAKELQVKLQQEITDLKRYAGLRQLLPTEDQSQFLLKYASLPCLPESTTLPVNTLPVRYFQDVTESVSADGKKLKDSRNCEWNKILMRVREVEVLLPQDPKTRDEFSQYADEFSQYADRGSNFQLDQNTAGTQLLLSERNRKATKKKAQHFYTDQGVLTGKFVDRCQALCETGLTGRHYWEVEWTGLGVSVAVAYKDIARTGVASIFGENDKSWALECKVTRFHTMYKFKHDGDISEQFIPKEIPPERSSRVGVFLDYKARILSFYIISAQSFTFLDKFEVKEEFSHPLYAGLGVYYNGATAEFCDVSRQRVTVDLSQETAAVWISKEGFHK